MTCITCSEADNARRELLCGAQRRGAVLSRSVGATDHGMRRRRVGSVAEWHDRDRAGRAVQQSLRGAPRQHPAEPAGVA